MPKQKPEEGRCSAHRSSSAPSTSVLSGFMLPGAYGDRVAEGQGCLGQGRWDAEAGRNPGRCCPGSAGRNQGQGRWDAEVGRNQGRRGPAWGAWGDRARD